MIDTSLPSFHIITPFRELDSFYLTPTYYENRECNSNNLISTQSKFYDTYTELDLELDTLFANKTSLDTNNIESNKYLKDILDSLLLDYPKAYFSYRILSIRIAYSLYEYLLIIPKSIPKFIAKILKEKRDKESLEYGYGSFIDLSRDYVRECSVGERGDNTGISLLTIQGKIFLSPSGMSKIRVEVR
ncbi:hypothetical protein CQA53_11795 [Helicobacter didelphidarum]|uniref:Uncharacterized protein n=1 Tax=Helicobacter didelphidarum TaxID=2040648 RepID=A0A3D8I1I6_9HELI|nr:hypothetical protein [Helicobacter didelphidarum]RDU58856.1 hypothetical protein CQA53_11795 [Helicobacter didelphidarum]